MREGDVLGCGGGGCFLLQSPFQPIRTSHSHLHRSRPPTCQHDKSNNTYHQSSVHLWPYRRSIRGNEGVPSEIITLFHDTSQYALHTTFTCGSIPRSITRSIEPIRNINSCRSRYCMWSNRRSRMNGMFPRLLHRRMHNLCQFSERARGEY